MAKTKTSYKQGTSGNPKGRPLVPLTDEGQLIIIESETPKIKVDNAIDYINKCLVNIPKKGLSNSQLQTIKVLSKIVKDYMDDYGLTPAAKASIDRLNYRPKDKPEDENNTLLTLLEQLNETKQQL